MTEPFQDESLAKQLEGALKASGLYYQLKKHVQVGQTWKSLIREALNLSTNKLIIDRVCKVKQGN